MDAKKTLGDNATPEKILERARAAGYELTEDELEQISGGAWNETTGPDKKARICPYCGSTDTRVGGVGDDCRPYFECRNCGRTFSDD